MPVRSMGLRLLVLLAGLTYEASGFVGGRNPAKTFSYILPNRRQGSWPRTASITLSSTSLTSSPEWLRLENAKSGDEALRAFTQLSENGGIRFFNSTRLVGQRRVTPTELRMLTRINGDVSEKIGVSGNKDVDRLAAALLGVVVFAMVSGGTGRRISLF